MKTEKCVGCGEAVSVRDDYEAEYCCSGLRVDCCCMGYPVNPVLCNSCEEEVYGEVRVREI